MNWSVGFVWVQLEKFLENFESKKFDLDFNPQSSPKIFRKF